jgi:hypothetical protein
MNNIPQATKCSPAFTYLMEMDLACTYAMSQPELAFDCAATALHAAHEMRRPDLAYIANELMGNIGGGL